LKLGHETGAAGLQQLQGAPDLVSIAMNERQGFFDTVLELQEALRGRVDKPLRTLAARVLATSTHIGRAVSGADGMSAAEAKADIEARSNDLDDLITVEVMGLETVKSLQLQPKAATLLFQALVEKKDAWIGGHLKKLKKTTAGASKGGKAALATA
jgi:predicted PilT family ATPase